LITNVKDIAAAVKNVDVSVKRSIHEFEQQHAADLKQAQAALTGVACMQATAAAQSKAATALKAKLRLSDSAISAYEI
jgi:hypothetical protein